MSTKTSPPPDGRSARRVLNPSVRVLWRSPQAVQLELGGTAVVVDGVEGTLVAHLLGRSASLGEQHASAPEQLAATLAELDAAGFLARIPGPDDYRPPPRLAADLAALRIRHGDGAAEVLQRRRSASALVIGTTRPAALVAALLAAAGVGRVCVGGGAAGPAPTGGSGDVGLAQAVPGGTGPDDEGRRFVHAAVEAIRRAAPECDTGPPAASGAADLAVLCADGPVDPDLRASLHLRALPHLALAVPGDRAVIGPLVLPGATSCLHCADLHRLDRDPAWSALAVQLAVAPRHTAPSDVALASVAAGICALQALAFLDGEQPTTLDATLELTLPDWRVRRRSWQAHTDCDCGASSAFDRHSAQ